MADNLLLLQVSELFLQCGHLIQAFHPPPLTVLIIHLCSREDMTDMTLVSHQPLLKYIFEPTLD